MNASSSRVEYRNSEILTKSKNIIPPPSTTVESLKSDTPRPGPSKSNNEQNGSTYSKGKAMEKRKPNGHPNPKPGTSMEATKVVPTKKRKIETPQKAACPMDLILDEMNNLESQKRKAKKKDDSDSESMKGLQKADTPLPGSFRAPTYLDLLRIESDNSMVFEFLNKRVPSVCEMVLAYKMLRGRVDNFNLTYFDRTKIKNIQNHIPPDEELLIELRGPEVYEIEIMNRHKGPRTPSGSPPSPTPPPEEKNMSKYPAGFVPDDDQSSQAQEKRKTEVKKYLAKRVNKGIKDVEAMLTESHWKMMGALKQELSFAMIDSMVEAAVGTTKDSNEGLASNSPNGNSARNSVAMDISSNSSSINGKVGRIKSVKQPSMPITTPFIMSSSSQHLFSYPEQNNISSIESQIYQQPHPSIIGSTLASNPIHPPVQHLHQMQYHHHQLPNQQIHIPNSNSYSNNNYQIQQGSNQPEIRYPPNTIMHNNFSDSLNQISTTNQGISPPTITSTPPFQLRGQTPQNRPSRPLSGEGDFRKQNKRGGIKMNKSQKRFQEFNNRPQGLDPKFAKIDMELIRNRPPPPIPKIIMEENKKNIIMPPLTVRFPAAASSSGISAIPPPPNAISPNHLLQGQPMMGNPQTLQTSPAQMPIQNLTPINNPRMPSLLNTPVSNRMPFQNATPQSQQPPRFQPPPHMIPPRFASPMPQPRYPLVQNPNNSSIMRTLFSALQPNTISQPPSQPQRFRPQINIPRMPPGPPPHFRPPHR